MENTILTAALKRTGLELFDPKNLVRKNAKDQLKKVIFNCAFDEALIKDDKEILGYVYNSLG